MRGQFYTKDCRYAITISLVTYSTVQSQTDYRYVVLMLNIVLRINDTMLLKIHCALKIYPAGTRCHVKGRSALDGNTIYALHNVGLHYTCS